MLAKKKLLRDRREKAVVPCINHLANSCWEKVLNKTSALVSGRWYYCKNVTSGLLAEESQKKTKEKKDRRPVSKCRTTDRKRFCDL